MRGLRGGRRATGVTVAAAGALVIGSWLVVTSATASPAPVRPPSLAGSAALAATAAPGTTGAGTLPVASPLSVPGSPGTSTGATTPLVTVPPTSSTTAVATTDPSTTAPTPSTSAPAPAPTGAPVTTAPAVLPRAAGRRHRGPGAGRHRGTTTSAQPSSAEADRVAVQLIAALNLQGRGGGRVPATGDNVALLARWMTNEGGLWADNPLNTSLDAGDYPHQFSSGGQDTGIPIFPTMAAGVRATATTLLSNAAYSRIVRLLRNGAAPCLSFAKAVIASPWASSHYGYDTSRFCAGAVPAPTFRR